MGAVEEGKGQPRHRRVIFHNMHVSKGNYSAYRVVNTPVSGSTSGPIGTNLPSVG